MEHSEVSDGLTRGLRPSLGTIRLASSYDCRSSSVRRCWDGFEAEVGAVDPHPMHDDGELSRQRHLGTLRAAAAGDGHGSGLQRRPGDGPGHHDVGCLKQSATDGDV